AHSRRPLQKESLEPCSIEFVNLIHLSSKVNLNTISLKWSFSTSSSMTLSLDITPTLISQVLPNYVPQAKSV
ncbi:hypothetical protein PENTCL1PPCAC_29240, partial [Pristionchus entomophagus]